MLFNSFSFFAFLLATFAAYYLPGLRRHQIATLTIASFIFYGWSAPALVTLLVLSIAINATASWFVRTGAPSSRRAWAVAGVLGNLLTLLFFKYGRLVGSLLPEAVQANDVVLFVMTLPLPIGISFFTFQGISLVVDTFRDVSEGKEPSHRFDSFSQHLRSTAFFKAFFPQLVSGPIVKAHEFMPQIGEKALASINWKLVSKQLIVGYFLKTVLADNLKDHTFWIAWPYFEGFSALTLLTHLLGYSCQIFADFAGYSLIAMGLAELFGYHLPLNFDHPYISKSFSEFWRRWHISLSSWLREYLYVPLGGNRRGEVRTYANLIIVMALGGLWHGAALSYAVWGLWHGIALAIERPFLRRLEATSGSTFMNLLRGTVVFAVVTAGWLLFKLPRFEDVLAWLRALLDGNQKPHHYLSILGIAIYGLPVALYHLNYLLRRRERGPAMEALPYGILLFAIIVNHGTPGAFIYFQF